MITENISKRIHSLRFPVIGMIVLSHCANSLNESNMRGVDFPQYMADVEIIIKIICSSTVPLFFIISAYLAFFSYRTSNYITFIKKRIKSLAIPYLLWITLFVLICIVVTNVSFTKVYFTSETNPIFWSPLKWVGAYCGYYHGISDVQRQPFYGAFWFIRDLFVLDILFVFIYKLVDRFPVATIVLCFALWVNNIQLFIVSPEALCCFVIGLYAAKYNLNEKQLDWQRMLDISLIYIISVLCLFYSKGSMPIIHQINVLVGSVFLLKLAGRIIMQVKLYDVLKRLEKQEFIVYTVHDLLIAQAVKLYIMSPLARVPILLYFVCGFAFVITMSVLFGMVFNKIAPGLFMIMTGLRRIA
jgi:fucose 4-O-acetylase-like acetyltransferase